MSVTIPEELYSAKEAARYLKIGVNHMWRLARIPPEEGGPPKILVAGTMMRFPIQAFKEWVANSPRTKGSKHV